MITTTELSRRILYTAYPLIPVGAESAGGAEQMLATLEAEMFHRGHRTTTAACAGSQVCGEFFPASDPSSANDSFDAVSAASMKRIVEFTAQRQFTSAGFELIHDTGGCLREAARQLPLPLLMTLHLPRHFYSAEMFCGMPANVFFNCVSWAQRYFFQDVPGIIGVVQNGIALERFTPKLRKSDYLLWLGRICQEKGAHLALDAADRARLPIVIAGEVYPFSAHRRYFRRWVLPRIRKRRYPARLVLKPSLPQKIDLLRNARALLVPSLVDETSSLVSMEAMACGTPVVAFPRGALSEVVKHGKTGLIVGSLREMAQAAGRVQHIDPRACRERAEARFSAIRMADDYERLYAQVIANCSALAAVAD